MTALGGIYAAITTPFDDSGRPAYDQFAAHLRHLAARGCHGVLIAGTTGEGPSLSVAERIGLVRAAAEANTGLKLLVGTGAASLPDAIELSRAAFDTGAAGIVVIPPFFYARPTLAGLTDFYARLIDSAVPRDGRLLLYHNPAVSAPLIEPTLIARLRDAYPDQVVGIKDSSGDFAYTQALLNCFPGFQVYVGDDRLLNQALPSGAVGSITALANLFPDLDRALFDLHRAGEPLDSAQERITLAYQQIVDLPRIAAIKWLLTLGKVLDSDAVRPPLSLLSSEQIDVLRERFSIKVPMSQVADLSKLGSNSNSQV